MNKMTNKKKVLFGLIIVAIIGLIVTLFINIYMIMVTKDKIIDVNDIKDNNIDAILVLGCKTEDGIASLMLEYRLNKVIEIYNNKHYKVIVSGDNTRDDYDEVNVMTKYLVNHGVSENDIIKDYAGISTYDSIYRAKEVFGLKNIIIVTQKYHLYRALYIANSFDIDSVGIAADDIPQKLIMLKNKVREIFSRDKNYFKVMIKPESKYLTN